ncbi:aminoglycoside phosphotransferase [Ornithinimicrobium murale]|uniref:aminoglycoside phosphotransferase n=1 Tax=Ornithinimicrobium murale TaxID=1050153 RepID=UPI000E0DF890|nr:aminoglycoside phosphotransferase [Ornithinimicrobium murale]
MLPSPRVFDLFAVPEHPVPVDGGRGHSVRAGDLVLSPGRDEATAQWLNPVLARLSADLDHQEPRSVRVAMPIPTRDLRWVVDGWGASRFEPDARPCRDLDVLRATARLLHAHLASAVPEPPAALAARDDRWRRAEQATFGEDPPLGILGPDLADEWVRTPDLGPGQLVHADLAGNVLLDATGLPVVIDVAPSWRPVLWAEAVLVLDAVLWQGADPAVLREWSAGDRRQAMLRAALFRVLSDPEPDPARYRAGLDVTPG